MKNIRKPFFKTICSIVIIFAITCTTSLSAQLIPGGQEPPVEGEGGDAGTNAIPLDGGLAILLLGAAAFGIKKLRGNKSGEA